MEAILFSEASVLTRSTRRHISEDGILQQGVVRVSEGDLPQCAPVVCSQLYRDVLVMCGTNPAFRILRNWIEQRELRGEDASEVMSMIPSHLQTPGADIIREYYVSTPTTAVEGHIP
jgi:hypothetical protein